MSFLLLLFSGLVHMKTGVNSSKNPEIEGMYPHFHGELAVRECVAIMFSVAAGFRVCAKSIKRVTFCAILGKKIS